MFLGFNVTSPRLNSLSRNVSPNARPPIKTRHHTCRGMCSQTQAINKDPSTHLSEIEAGGPKSDQLGAICKDLGDDSRRIGAPWVLLVSVVGMTKRHLDNLPTSIRFGLRRLLLRQLIPPFRVRLKDLVTIRRDAAGIHILSVSFQGLLRHPIQGAPEFHACYMVRDEMSSSPVDVRDHPSELSEPCCVRRCWAKISHTPEKPFV